MDDDYARELHIEAPTSAVYAALTTLDGCSAWWAPASGSASAGGELRFTFDDPDAPLILRVADGTTDLRFRHAGLNPRLECFNQCQAGWNYYLPSLRAYAETGTGTPYRR